MTPKQLFKLLKYIMENNSWNKLMETHERNRRAIKYTDFSFDSRDGKVWQVTLRDGCGERKVFRVDSQSDIDEMYNWLDTPLREE